MRNTLLWLTLGVGLLLMLRVLSLAASSLILTLDELGASVPGVVVCAFAACFVLLALLVGVVLRRRRAGKPFR